MSKSIRYIRVSISDRIVSIHRDFVDALNPNKLDNDAVIDVFEHDISSLCDVTTIKKGLTVEGLYKHIRELEKQESIIALMVNYLDKCVVDDGDNRKFRTDGLYSLDYFAGEVAYYGLDWDDFLEQYTDIGQARLDARNLEKLEKAEHQALSSANLEKAKEHYAGACFSLPALAGKMGRDIYYTVQIPFHQVQQLFIFNEEDVPVELRAQRELNLKHAEKAAQYLIDRPFDFTLPALTASVSEAMQFEPVPGFTNVGSVKIPIGALMILNDGQHRRKAIELALQKNKGLRDNDISVVLFYDQGLERSQQRFADINANMKKPTNAINVLFDKRNAFNQMLLVSLERAMIKSAVDFEANTPKRNSSKIWSVMAIKKAAEILLGINANTYNGLQQDLQDKYLNLFCAFIAAFVRYAPQLEELVNSSSASKVANARIELVNTHAVYLQACALAAREMCADILADIDNVTLDNRTLESDLPIEHIVLKVINGYRPLCHFEKLAVISNISVSKSNAIWFRRIINEDGTMNPTSNGIKLGAAVILKHAGIVLPKSIADIDELMFGEKMLEVLPLAE